MTDFSAKSSFHCISLKLCKHSDHSSTIGLSTHWTQRPVSTKKIDEKNEVASLDHKAKRSAVRCYHWPAFKCNSQNNKYLFRLLDWPLVKSRGNLSVLYLIRISSPGEMSVAAVMTSSWLLKGNSTTALGTQLYLVRSNKLFLFNFFKGRRCPWRAQTK